jgi:hypothetical protein
MFGATQGFLLTTSILISQSITYLTLFWVENIQNYKALYMVLAIWYFVIVWMDDVILSIVAVSKISRIFVDIALLGYLSQYSKSAIGKNIWSNVSVFQKCVKTILCNMEWMLLDTNLPALATFSCNYLGGVCSDFFRTLFCKFLPNKAP